MQTEEIEHSSKLIHEGPGFQMGGSKLQIEYNYVKHSSMAVLTSWLERTTFGIFQNMQSFEPFTPSWGKSREA